jgi:mRNA interferase RelE/StbE
MKAVRYSRDAAKALRKHSNMSARLKKAIEDYASDPTARANTVTQLVGTDAKRLRVGDYRIIFAESEDTIIVTKIAPRGAVYT